MTTQTAAAQQCFRSRPLLQEKGSVVSFFSCMARQKCTHGVSLHERAGVSPAVPPFLQRLLAICIRCRIVLRHLQLIGIEFDHLAAGTFSLAFEMLHKLAHSPPIRRSSEAALKRSVIVFLNFDRAADLSSRSFTSSPWSRLRVAARHRWCSASFAAVLRPRLLVFQVDEPFFTVPSGL